MRRNEFIFQNTAFLLVNVNFGFLFMHRHEEKLKLLNLAILYLICLQINFFKTPKFLNCPLYLTLPIDSNTGDFNFIYRSFQIAWFHFRIAGISQIFHFFAAKCEICQFKVFELTRENLPRIKIIAFKFTIVISFVCNITGVWWIF